MIIDFHGHFYPRIFMEEIARHGAKYGVGLKKNETGLEFLQFEGIDFWAYSENFFDINRRIKELDEAEVNLQVLSLGPPMVYWADAELGLRLCQILNDEIARIVERYPNRFIGFAALPFQDTKLAIQELKRARHSLGLAGVQIGSNIHGKMLDHPDLWPIYEQIEAEKMPMFLHPINPPWQSSIHDYRLDILVAFPFETTLAAARLIFGGVMEQFPDLKICFAHLGGALPFLKDRLDVGWRTLHPFLKTGKKISKPPSYYFKLLYLDVAAYYDPALLCSLASSGSDRLIMGSDTPFPVGDLKKTVEYIRNFQFTSEIDKDKILGGNAAGLLHLKS